MVTLSSEAAWGHAARRVATLPGRRDRETGAAASGPPGRPSTGTSGVIPESGKDWAGSRQRVAEPGAATVRMRTSGAAEDSEGGGRNLSPGRPALRCGGAAAPQFPNLP